MNLKKQTTTAGESVTISYAHGEADFSDLVHVVRCGQCKFFQSSGCFVGVQGAKISSDNYCAWGQRKDG